MHRDNLILFEEMSRSKIEVSVIVCCYNSASRIKDTLYHLSRQNVGDLEFEILLIDNNCSDDTVQVARTFWDELHQNIELRIILEQNPGLSNARKTGVTNSNGEIIIFCDDDNWLSEDYLARAYLTMLNNQKIGLLAGQSIAVSDCDLPNWFYSYYNFYACGVLALESGDVTDRMEIWGAGMVLRRSLMLYFYDKFSHLTLDRTQGNYESGGDSEICLWHILGGYRLWYDEFLILHHYMPAKRISIDEAIKQIKGQANSSHKLGRLRNYAWSFLKVKNGQMTLGSIFKNLITLKVVKFSSELRVFIKIHFKALVL
jgi:glycosyltransferase involved in cell wall biosynthesis